jgi:hypothetical protein
MTHDTKIESMHAIFLSFNVIHAKKKKKTIKILTSGYDKFFFFNPKLINQ